MRCRYCGDTKWLGTEPCHHCDNDAATKPERTREESFLSSAWLGELEAALRPLERLRERAYNAKRYDIASMAQEMKLRLSGAMHRERSSSPSIVLGDLPKT